jgi:hypothetical protein
MKELLVFAGSLFVSGFSTGLWLATLLLNQMNAT